ncbi:hypothetical protein ACIQAD_23855 [Streptomyces sp. NPDC088551]|uniref:hypothetical protein n=1 Tax=Streptomyces sp. NPDC088551 TaxID=3365863 RepID=UPI00380899C5
MTWGNNWLDTRLKNLFTSVRNGTWGDDPDGLNDVFCARGTDFDRTTNRISPVKMPRRSVARSARRDHQLSRGDLVIEKSGGSTDQPVGSVALFDLDVPTVCSNFNARMKVSASVDSRFACYLMNGLYWSGFTRQFIKQTTGIQNLDAESLLAEHCAIPPHDEQRRIADFLDTETARIDAIMSIRRQQASLSRQRFNQVLDGAVIGNPEILREINYKGSTQWGNGKVSRLFSVTPGYSFPSHGFVDREYGTPLLRGINVAPGRVDWSTETVAWDLETSKIDQKFHLSCEDLVIGMDRPWIGSGARIALVQEFDLPALLLQRVARVRSHGLASTRYLRWVLSSSHFRYALEGETTGVSVPHISGEQIGSFTYLLPPRSDELQLAALLGKYRNLHDEQSRIANAQLVLLSERRQALITAAVTGQFDVTTAGRSTTPGGTA